MVTHDFQGLKTMTFHRVADIAYFWLAVTEIIQFFSRNVTPETCLNHNSKLDKYKIAKFSKFGVLSTAWWRNWLTISGYIYLMCWVSAHVNLLTFCFWYYGIFILRLEKPYDTCIVWSHEKKGSQFVLFYYYFKMLWFSCFILVWIKSFSFKLRMNASCMYHVCIINVSQMYDVFNILTEKIDKRQRMSISLF